jgi:hypothetical protein
MKAGRELDSLVAEKFMGHGSGYPLPNDFKYLAEVPCYSTDIAAAWEVVEHLRQAYKIVDVLLTKSYASCKLYDDETFISVDADTASLAICLAALKTVGVELEVTT